MLSMNKNSLIKGAIICALLSFTILNTGYSYKLTRELGRVRGCQEVETWYNLPMDKVVQTMRDRGYTEADYPYYIREDGAKMLGDFIIVAADFNQYRRGSIVMTTLGQAIVCDTGEDLEGFDIAVEW